MPQTICTTVYSFDELSDDAKQVAIEKERDWRLSYNDDDCNGERRDSLDAFCKCFGISWDTYGGEVVFRNLPKFEYRGEETIYGLRLHRWLINNHGDLFTERKRLTPYGKPERRSRVLFTDTCCPFTGVCYDEVLLDPMRKFLQKPLAHRRIYDLHDLLTDCAHSFNHCFQRDIEYYTSDEAITESLQCEDTQYNEDGTVA